MDRSDKNSLLSIGWCNFNALAVNAQVGTMGLAGLPVGGSAARSSQHLPPTTDGQGRNSAFLET